MKKLLIILSLLMTFVLGCAKTVKTFEINAEPGTKVPNFELKDFKGVKTKSRKIFNNGKPTLFIVAAEWCPDCHMELPDVQKFYEENKDNVNVVVVFTNKKSSLLNAKKYVETQKFTFPVYYDFDGSISKGFKITEVPTNVKINKSVIEDFQKGTMQIDGLNKMFEK